MEAIMNRFAATGLLLGVFGLLGGCASQTESPAQMVSAAKGLDQQFTQAFSSADVDGVMATYWNSPDLRLYPPDVQEVDGWQAVKDEYSKTFAALQGAKVAMLDPNYLVAGEYVIGWGAFQLTSSGSAAPVMGRYTEVAAKRDGKWVYIVDHASIPTAPGPTTQN
jgi:ketosteroid isomerase-like protein